MEGQEKKEEAKGKESGQIRERQEEGDKGTEGKETAERTRQTSERAGKGEDQASQRAVQQREEGVACILNVTLLMGLGTDPCMPYCTFAVFSLASGRTTSGFLCTVYILYTVSVHACILYWLYIAKYI